jgi:hypothetical protein
MIPVAVFKAYILAMPRYTHWRGRPTAHCRRRITTQGQGLCHASGTHVRGHGRVAGELPVLCRVSDPNSDRHWVSITCWGASRGRGTATATAATATPSPIARGALGVGVGRCTYCSAYSWGTLAHEGTHARLFCCSNVRSPVQKSDSVW